MGLFIWTWTEEITDWCHQDSPCPQKCRQRRRSGKSQDQCSLQLREHALCVWWLSWHYSTYSLLQKTLRTSFVSSTALYVTTLPVVMICCVPWPRSVTWPIQWLICSEDGSRKFTNIHYSHWIYAHVTTISFRKWTITFHLLQDDVWWWCKWKDQAISDISRTDTADGVRRLLHVQQCFCNVAWHYIYSL